MFFKEEKKLNQEKKLIAKKKKRKNSQKFQINLKDIIFGIIPTIIGISTLLKNSLLKNSRKN